MNRKDILDALDQAGEALKATGETTVSLSYSALDRQFGVGIVSEGGRWCDVFAHADTPSAAFVKALAKRAEGAEEAALRARIAEEVEQRVRAELRKEAA